MSKLPNDWKIEHLNSFGIFIRGVSYKKGELLKDKTLNSVFLIRSNNIREKLDLTDLQIVPKELAEGKIIQNKIVEYLNFTFEKNMRIKSYLNDCLNDIDLLEQSLLKEAFSGRL